MIEITPHENVVEFEFKRWSRTLRDDEFSPHILDRSTDFARESHLDVVNGGQGGVEALVDDERVIDPRIKLGGSDIGGIGIRPRVIERGRRLVDQNGDFDFPIENQVRSRTWSGGSCQLGRPGYPNQRITSGGAATDGLPLRRK